MSSRDKELKSAFLKVFSEKLHNLAPTYFKLKRDPLVESMTFTDEELLELETEIAKVLLQESSTDEN